MWLIYALGGGWGHLTRAIALARIAQRRRPVRILTNSPYACAISGSLDVVAFDPMAPAAATRAAVIRAIAECRPACLIVDTFPRGIGGELAGVIEVMAVPKVLVHRDLNPRYAAAVGLRQFVAAHYDLVLLPGAGEGSHFGDLPQALETPPWLVRSTDEIPDRGCASRILRLSPGEPCILVCAAGKPVELAWYGRVVCELHRIHPTVAVRCLAAARPAGCPEESWVRYWPAIDLLGSAAVVVGGAGYNTVHECLAWGVPLVARPWPRLYDRQELRATRAAAASSVTVVREREEAAQAALAHLARVPDRAPKFVNGAAEAVRRIAGLC